MRRMALSWKTSSVFGGGGLAANKQLQRTVRRRHMRAASASFHYALAARSNPQRAAAELGR